MRKIIKAMCLSTLGASILAGCSTMPPATGEMSFFVTSVGPGQGGNLGGIEGADRHCQTLAQAAGAGGRTWHAYLSSQAATLTGKDFVNARDRIGNGPWYNAKGELVAANIEDLHSTNSKLSKQTVLDENGRPINGRTEKPNKHDMLTGSRPDGTAFPGTPFPDMTCGNWTRSSPEGAAMTGHFDRAGPLEAAWAVSWNSAHPTLGCSQEKIRPSGGDGLFYCFAVK